MLRHVPHLCIDHVSGIPAATGAGLDLSARNRTSISLCGDVQGTCRSSTITYHVWICPLLSFHSSPWRLNPNSNFSGPRRHHLSSQGIDHLFPECLILTVSLSFLFETSKVLCTVTKLRIVWINALYRVCLMHGINLSTFYPVENISQIELEHAAFSPFRFIKYAKDDIPFEGDIKFVVTRILEPRLPPVFSTDENVPFNCQAVLLIPGGRFLFTDTTEHGVPLWDLGIHAGIPMKLSPLAVLPTTMESIVRFTSPTPDGHGVYVCIEEKV